jgi:Leucine-rich repeat (LRR) protein
MGCFSHLNSAPPSSSFSMHTFILLCFGLFVTSVVGMNNETDRLALLAFKARITHDPLQVLSSWNDSIHFCQWQGVTCGRRHQRVTKLYFRSMKLVGSISPHIGNLSFMRILVLQNNSFKLEIPPEVGRLRRLQILALDNNTIGGEIPSNISNCSNLIRFSVSYNQLVGETPSTLASLTKLQFFATHVNNLTGSISPDFGNLSSLEVFSVASNNLGGIIPDSFGQLKKLTYFAFGINRFSGTFPPSIFNISSIINFDVGSNQIQGQLSSDIGITLPNVEVFSIGENQFTGSIPDSISNATNLDTLILGPNKLSGKFPSLEKLNLMSILGITLNNLGNGGANDLSFLCSLTNATSLFILAINANNFGGSLPQCIGNLSNTLFTFALDNNKISGNLPTGIGNLINLERLEMYKNKLSGSIPFEIGKLQKLNALDLSKNNFSGNIPSSLGNLTTSTRLYLNENNLQGSIPLTLGQCQNLIILSLDNNNLSGTISSQVIGLSFSPIFLDLSANQFTGVLPLEVGQLKNLEYLDVSDNMLFGKIPASLGSCVKLDFLAMRRNFFQGEIPSSLELLRGLGLLDLSTNNLSGMIPKFLERFDLLKTLNLSYNQFEGEIPTGGVFMTMSATSVKGNSKLCGGIPKFQLPKCENKKSKKRKLSGTMKLILSILFGLVGLALVCSFLFLFWLRKKKREDVSSTYSRNLILNLSYQDLLEATNGFSTANLTGVGNFGTVYKGVLDQGRNIIAVKVFNLVRRGAFKSFIAECEALRNIRHRNLVKVLTVCSSIDYNGNDFKALVYEFMVNGNLDEWLHPDVRSNEAPEERRNLNLLQRLNVAIDVASALEYLHHHCQTPIVHCDLKPSNILLDDEMIGHVGDFGLARFLIEATQDYSMNQSSSIGVKGTIGYAPPGEYLSNFKFSCFPLPKISYYCFSHKS